MTNLIPLGVGRDELVAILEDITQRVRDGDSFEGNLTYEIPEPDAPPMFPSADHEFWVSGVYRIGNSQGQGGVRMIGEPPPAPEMDTDGYPKEEMGG